MGTHALHPPIRRLATLDAVMRELGDEEGLAALTGQKPKAIGMWRYGLKRFPSKTYVVMQEALRGKGYSAPASLWGMIESPDVVPAEFLAAENLEQENG